MVYGEFPLLQMSQEPRSGGRADWLSMLRRGVGRLEQWEQQWPAFESMLHSDTERAAEVIGELAERLQDNLPYFHPLYAGHMLKPPHPVAWAAYALTMLVNPNNHSRESSQATTEMEFEVVERLARMVGFDGGHGGHLTSSGTMANLEAMFIARELHPDKAIACSEAAHYNYARIARLLRVPLVTVPTRADQTIDPDALADVLRDGEVGTVVATLGTTGLGVVDPLDDILAVTRRYGARVHVDAAYGGFFALLAARHPPLVRPAPFEAMGFADSVTIDPHKHGLQPYGCGCILFGDGAVLSHHSHESPYTYLDRESLHLGQIQFECSRSGASAAALWATLEALPLEREAGLGELLAGCRRAATGWGEALDESPYLRKLVEPHLDIVSFAVWPRVRGRVRASEVTGWTDRMLELGARADDEPFYLTRYDVPCETATQLWPDLHADAESVSVLRSCMMKPEHEAWWPALHERVSEAARRSQP